MPWLKIEEAEGSAQKSAYQYFRTSPDATALAVGRVRLRMRGSMQVTPCKSTMTNRDVRTDITDQGPAIVCGMRVDP